jgi:hypothetical protein
MKLDPLMPTTLTKSQSRDMMVPAGTYPIGVSTML